MRTQFDSLLVAINQKITSCENEICKINQKITSCENEIVHLLHQMQEVEIPLGGNVLLFREFYESKRAYMQMVDLQREKISTLKQTRKEKEKEYQGLLIKQEKMKYLQQKQRARLLEEMKRKEQKEFDEIANTQFLKQWRLQ